MFWPDASAATEDNSGRQSFSHSILGLVVGSLLLLIMESYDWPDIVSKYAYEFS